MAQTLSLSALTGTASQNGGVRGSAPPRRRRQLLNVMSKTQNQIKWNNCVQSLIVKRNPNSLRRRDTSVRAGWLFKGSGGGDQSLDASSERSETANEDILIFFFQLDLATRVQYALNMEQYDIAQELRNKLTEVEAEIVRQQEEKRGLSSKSEAQDKAISIIRVRAELQNAIENENYALAAKLRDEIANLEAESLAATAKALAHRNAQYAYRLGQKVRHKVFGYRAVVCGMDPLCCESSSWMETAQVEKLSRGPNQPFYQVLVDVHEDPNLLVAYVAEENLLTPDSPDMGRFDHPYISFYSMGWTQLGILYQSSSFERNSIGPAMKYPLIQMTMRETEAMLERPSIPCAAFFLVFQGTLSRSCLHCTSDKPGKTFFDDGDSERELIFCCCFYSIASVVNV